MNTIIEGLQAYFETYSGITGTGTPVLVDFLGKIPTTYSIVPLDGSRVIATYLNDSKEIQFPFSFQSRKYTIQDAQRIADSGFLEALGDWLDSQTEAGILPTLPSGKTAEKIQAVGHAYLSEEGQTTGVYLIQCLLTYKQD